MKQAKIDHAKIVMVGGICDGKIALQNWLSKLNRPFKGRFNFYIIFYLRGCRRRQDWDSDWPRALNSKSSFQKTVKFLFYF